MSNVPNMTLRDWFAGQALCGLVVYDHDTTMSKVVSVAYAYADRMMAEREKTLNIQSDSTLLQE